MWRVIEKYWIFPPLQCHSRIQISSLGEYRQRARTGPGKEIFLFLFLAFRAYYVVGRGYGCGAAVKNFKIPAVIKPSEYDFRNLGRAS
jgi:hypothetical protein